MRSNEPTVHTDSWKWPFHRKNRTTTTQQQQEQEKQQQQEQEQRCQTPVLVTKKAVAAAVGAVAA